jgi:L-alanine-DL-glutamate epimerase-like enolase superfamily enzyme
VEAVHAAIGPDAGIRVDANEAWTPGAAIRIINEMAPFGLELAEQPVTGRNLTEMAYLRSRLDVPLLANEASWTRWHHLEIIKQGAADVVSVDNQMDGGLANLKAGAAMLEIAGLPVLKHSLGELGVATYAGAHLLASIPNALYASQAYGSFLADDVIEGASPLPYRDGSLSVPDGPGLGVTLDTERVGRYADAYRSDPDGYAFRDSGSLEATPVMPKF